MTNSDSSPRFIPHHRQVSRLKLQLLFCVPPPNQRGRGISYRLIFAAWVTQLLWQTAPKIYYTTTPTGRQLVWGTRRPDAAIHFTSPTLVCSMLSFVWTVRMLQPSPLAQLVTHIARHYCHRVCYCPAPFCLLIKQVCSTVRPNLSDTNRGRGEERPLKLRTKELPHCTAPPTRYYLVHAHLAVFHIHLVRTPTSSAHAVSAIWCAQELKHTAKRCKNSTKLISSAVSMAILLFTENW